MRKPCVYCMANVWQNTKKCMANVWQNAKNWGQEKSTITLDNA